MRKFQREDKISDAFEESIKHEDI